MRASKGPGADLFTWSSAKFKHIGHKLNMRDVSILLTYNGYTR